MQEADFGFRLLMFSFLHAANAPSFVLQFGPFDFDFDFDFDFGLHHTG